MVIEFTCKLTRALKQTCYGKCLLKNSPGMSAPYIRHGCKEVIE